MRVLTCVAEIGRRILKLPSFFSTSTVRICLCWPSMATRILIRKLGFLAKLLSSQDLSISSRLFTSAAITDSLNISIIQQYRLLESITRTDVLKLCLESPECAPSIVKSMKDDILKQDRTGLISSSQSHSSHYFAEIARDILWHLLWDFTLNRGVQGTLQLQRIIYLLSHPIFDRIFCSSCGSHEAPPDSWASHICGDHPPTIGDDQKSISLDDIIEALRHWDAELISIIFH